LVNWLTKGPAFVSGPFHFTPLPWALGQLKSILNPDVKEFVHLRFKFFSLIMEASDPRLESLRSYQILDTENSPEFDNLAQIASLSLETPIALISFVDRNRQWFKSHLGLAVSETERESSFCQHSFARPEEVLVINDAQKDERFLNNALVTGPPYIRFYAGAPLVSPEGQSLGTICTIGREPREITSNQKKILQLLAEKVMELLNNRREKLEFQKKINEGALLDQLTQFAPVVIFQFRNPVAGKGYFEFLSNGFEKLFANVDREAILNHPLSGLDAIHPDDLVSLQHSLEDNKFARHRWISEFRVRSTEKAYRWFRAVADPEVQPNGDVIYYGIVQDIHSHVEYEKAMEQIAFDISHVLRGPVTSLKGLTQLLADEQEVSPEVLKSYSSMILQTSDELDAYTRRLHDVYENKKQLLLEEKDRGT